jgi:hypothetical protein
MLDTPFFRSFFEWAFEIMSKSLKCIIKSMIKVLKIEQSEELKKGKVDVGDEGEWNLLVDKCKNDKSLNDESPPPDYMDRPTVQCDVTT